MKDRRLYEWVKTIHMYSGLLTFMAFVVWGVTGIHAVFLPGPDAVEPPPVSSVRDVPYQTNGALDDQQLSRAIYEAIAIPLKAGRYNVHRDADANLAFNVFTINGGREVTFFEPKGLVRIAHRRNSVWSYLSSMHTAFSRRHTLTMAAIAWGLFNELAVYAFVFMTVSGIYMWLATRPRLRWAQLSLAGMTAAVLALWIAIR
jgi:hypothetical protein